MLLQSRERMAAKSRTLLGLVWNAIIDFRTVNAFSWVFTAIVGMGVLLWAIERGFNEDEFRKPLFHGLSDGIWWAAGAVVPRPAVHAAPRSHARAPVPAPGVAGPLDVRQ